MNFKTTLALVALLALVGAYFYFIERDATPTYEVEQQSAEDPAGDALWDEAIVADDVERVALERGEQRIVIGRSDEAWAQVEPVRFPLNEYRPKQLIDAAAGLRFVTRFTPGGEQPSAAQLGLDPARAKVTLHAGDAERTILLGKTTSGGRAYVMLASDPQVYVVDDALHNAVLTGQLNDWRKKSFEAPQAAQLERVTLQRNGGEIVARKIDGVWYLDDAGTERASREAVADLARSAGGFYVSEFVSDSPERLSYYGLENPRLAVTLQKPAVTADAGPARSTLRIGGPANLEGDQHFATWSIGEEPSPVVFTVGQSTVDNLSRSIDDLRDPRIVLADPAAVREIEISRRDGEPIHLQQTPERWVFADPAPGFDLDPAAPRALVDALATARAVGFTTAIDDAEAPAARIALHVTGHATPERLTLFGPRESGDAGPRYVAVREGERVGYIVEADAVAPVFQPLLALRDKSILSVPHEEIARLTVEQPDGAQLVFSRGAHDEGDPAQSPADAFVLEGAEAKAFDRVALDSLMTEIAALEAESWATTRQAFSPDATLTVRLADGTERQLRVETASRLATIDGVEPLFTLHQSFVDRLTAEYRDRLVLPVTMEQIEAVTVASPDRTLVLRKSDSGRYTDDEGRSVDQAVAAGLFDTLAGLQAQRFLTVAPAIAEDDAVRFTIARRGSEPLTLVIDRQTDAAQVKGRDTAFRLGEEARTKLLAPLTTPRPSAPTPAAVDENVDDVLMGK